MAKVKLEAFTEADFDRFIGWIPSQEALVQFAGPTFQYPLTHSQLRIHLLAKDRKIFRVMYADQVIGHAEMIVSPGNATARLALLLIGEPAMRGKGLGHALVTELVRLAFEELHLHRVELNVYDFNQSAIACYQKVGFQKEGLLRENQKVGNVFWSTVVMGLLREEWAGRVE